MELNDLATQQNPFALSPAPFEKGTLSPNPLLKFALTPEAAWACTTCGACMEVCPTQNEQMLDIIDIAATRS
jgi:Fe-S oxidoreductase